METHLTNKKRKNCSDVSSRDCKISRKCEDNHTRRKPAVGNILWVRIPDCIWWPALVVGYNNKNRNNKSKRSKEEEVLARLYGSSELLYVDPAKYHFDFQNALKLNNFSYREILMKSLEQDTSQKGSVSCSKRVARDFKEGTGLENHEVEVKKNTLKQMWEENIISQKVDSSGRRKGSNTQSTKKKGNIKSEVDGMKSNNEKILKLKMAQGNQQTDNLDCRIHPPKDSPNLSLRPKKMMQKLGLIAPRGSPFYKNGLHLIT